jgi:hypothetical protein
MLCCVWQCTELERHRTSYSVKRRRKTNHQIMDGECRLPAQCKSDLHFDVFMFVSLLDAKFLSFFMGMILDFGNSTRTELRCTSTSMFVEDPEGYVLFGDTLSLKIQRKPKILTRLKHCVHAYHQVCDECGQSTRPPSCSSRILRNRNEQTGDFEGSTGFAKSRSQNSL